MTTAVYIVVIFYHPDTAAIIKGKSNGFTNVRFGCEDVDLEIVGDFHFRYRLIRFEEGSITCPMLLELGERILPSQEKANHEK